MNKMRKSILKIAFALLVVGSLAGCEVYAVIDTDKPMIVESVISENTYRVRYNDGAYYMNVITKDSLNVGDTLFLSKKP